MSVLMVEDEFLLLECVAEELEEAGLRVHRAQTATAALDILSGDTELDLLFTDIRMSGKMNGWDLAEIARTLRPGIEVIYASGHSHVGARPVSGSLFFPKPYRVYALVKRIQILGATALRPMPTYASPAARSDHGLAGLIVGATTEPIRNLARS